MTKQCVPKRGLLLIFKAEVFRKSSICDLLKRLLCTKKKGHQPPLNNHSLSLPPYLSLSLSLSPPLPTLPPEREMKGRGGEGGGGKEKERERESESK